MQMYPVKDRNRQLLAVGYEPVDGILAVQFAKGGGQHLGVPEDVFVKLRRAAFPYRQYKLTVQGKYPYLRDDEPQAKPSPAPPQQMHIEQPRKAVTNMEVFRPEDGMAFFGKDELGREIHVYTLKGERIPFSLTQILEIAGIARQPTEASELAARPAKAKLGTAVHELTLQSDQNDLDEEYIKQYPAYWNRIQGWRQFREDFHFQPDLTSCEVPIGVKLNGMLYAMKLDAYGCIGEGEGMAMAVVEKKCSCDIEHSFAIQAAGQAIAFKAHAESVQMPLKRYVVQLLDKPNGAKRFYKAQEYTDKADEKVFAAALTLVYWRYNKGLLKGVA